MKPCTWSYRKCYRYLSMKVKRCTIQEKGANVLRSADTVTEMTPCFSIAWHFKTT